MIISFENMKLWDVVVMQATAILFYCTATKRTQRNYLFTLVLFGVSLQRVHLRLESIFTDCLLLEQTMWSSP